MPPVDPKDLAQPIVKENLENGDEEQVFSVRDVHTWIDEVTNNIIKLLFVLFAFAGTGYCIVMFVGKEKSVDPNLAWGFFIGMLTTIMPAYFIMRKKDKNL